ncbi:MAG: STAS domain-containing protein [Thermoanaerobaculia bacterium]
MNVLKLQTEELPNGVIRIELEGFLDAHNYEKLESAFDNFFGHGRYCFIVDLSRLEYISSAGAGVFIGAAGTCQENGGDIVLVRPTPEVQEIFELLGVYQIFKVVRESDQALAHF